ncbi:MAG: hypothetical protein FJX40_08855 [Alphaproteobacteria bacterium]|nr:hypothetical protein [Alphaproteobacteria bacterium]
MQIITPMVNGFPCTGALARTATSIKAGAVTPLAGYFKGILKLTLAYFIADYLEMVPMACIGGILLWVASNMIKISEIKEVFAHNKFHAGLMIFTAVMVPATDFLTGVLSALVLYFSTRGFLDKPAAARAPVAAPAIAPEREIFRPGIFNHVAVALSLTDEDDELLRYAERLARLGILRDLHFVHIVTPGNGVISVDEARRLANQLVGSRFRDVGHKGKVTVAAVAGVSRLDELVKFTLNGADLILLGHRKGRSGARLLATRLAQITHCSVWMVPAGGPTAATNILAPIDFSERSADALGQAVAIARTAKVPAVTALHVYFDPSVLRYEEHESLVIDDEDAHFRQFMGRIDTDGVAVHPVYVESSRAADAILRQVDADGVDLIVLGTRGRSQAATILLGSVASEIIRRSPVPVLAIKHFGDQMTIKDVLLSGSFWRGPDMKAN